MKYKKFIFIICFIILFLFFNININALEKNGIKSLKVDKYELIPNFNTDIHNYNIFVPSKTKIIKIKATCLNNATIINKEKYNLKKGQNNIILTCKNDNEDIKYYLNVVRGKKKNKLGLENLTIEGYDIDFSPEKKDYTIDLKEKDDLLKIDFSTFNDNDTAKVSGNGNFYKGTNLIKITVKNDTEEMIYKIRAIKTTGVFKEINNNLEVNDISSTKEIILIIILILAILGLLYLFAYLLFFRKKRVS